MLWKYIVAFILMFFIDIIFIHFIMKRFFNPMIYAIQGKELNIRYGYSIITYIAMFASFSYFVIYNNSSILTAFFLGITTYTIFDMTNVALFTNYDPAVAIIDILYGGLLYAFIASIIKLMEKYIII